MTDQFSVKDPPALADGISKQALYYEHTQVAVSFYLKNKQKLCTAAVMVFSLRERY